MRFNHLLVVQGSSRKVTRANSSVALSIRTYKQYLQKYCTVYMIYMMHETNIQKMMIN